MKKSLREKIESLRIRLKERIQQLENFTEEYKDNNQFDEAMKCDIKRSCFKIMLNEIK